MGDTLRTYNVTIHYDLNVFCYILVNSNIWKQYEQLIKDISAGSIMIEDATNGINDIFNNQQVKYWSVSKKSYQGTTITGILSVQPSTLTCSGYINDTRLLLGDRYELSYKSSSGNHKTRLAYVCQDQNNNLFI